MQSIFRTAFYLRNNYVNKEGKQAIYQGTSDEALTAYCDAVAQGFTHPEAESVAGEVLYQGLHFSKYDTLVAVLENEFEEELCGFLKKVDSVNVTLLLILHYVDF